MADLDTRAKRSSSVNLLKSYQCALVTPDGSITQGDRQQTAWMYSGILASNPSGGGKPWIYYAMQRMVATH